MNLSNAFVQIFMPILCSMAAYRSIYNYYIWLFSPFSDVFEVLYTIITLCFFLLFPVVMVYIGLHRIRLAQAKGIILIVIAVLINIVYVMTDTGNVEIILRSYVNQFAPSTNDEMGFYFAQLNVWFGNAAILLASYIFVNNKKTLNKCLMAMVWVFLIPIIFTLILYPEYIGERESFISEMNFAGGLWNIGVVAFGSFSWLLLAQRKELSRGNRLIALLAVILFICCGVFGLSRTLIVMLIMSYGYYILNIRKDSRWLFIVVVSIVFAGLFLTLQPSLWDEMVVRFTDSTAGLENVRVLLWANYLSGIDEYWLIGAPEGSVYRYFSGLTYATHNYLPHSSIINFWCRFGVLAVIGYLTIVRYYFIGLKAETLELTKKKVALQSGCIAYMSLAFVNQTGYEESVFWITFGLIFSLIKIENGNRARST